MARELTGREVNLIRAIKRKSDDDKRSHFISVLAVVENGSEISDREFENDMKSLVKKMKLENFDEEEVLITKENRNLCSGNLHCMLCGADGFHFEKFCRDYPKLRWL